MVRELLRDRLQPLLRGRQGQHFLNVNFDNIRLAWEFRIHEEGGGSSVARIRDTDLEAHRLSPTRDVVTAIQELGWEAVIEGEVVDDFEGSYYQIRIDRNPEM